MKKFYTQPTIEQENLWVEAGIAISGDIYENVIMNEQDGSAGYLETNVW